MVITRFIMFSTAVAILIGCAKEVPPAEQFVRSRLPGELHDISYSADKKVICGSVDGRSDAQPVRFYSKWQDMSVEYEGSDKFSVRAYAEACELGWSNDQIIAEEKRLVDYAANLEVERKQAASREAHQRWLEQNAEAITSMHEAAQRASGR